MARTYLGYTQIAANANLDTIPHYPEVSGETGVVDATFDYGDARRYGATTTDLTGAANRTAILSMLASAVALGFNRVRPCPEGGTYLVNDNFTVTPTYSRITVDLDGGCLKLANTPNAGNVEAAWMWSLKAQSALDPLIGFRIINGTLDGSKDTVVWGTTSYGVVAYSNSYLQGCEVVNVRTHDFLTSGVQMFSGGLRAINVVSHDNTFHGIGVSIDSTFGDELAEVYNVLCEDNGGYGVDFAAGRIKASGILARRNTFGGGKTTNVCEYLSMTDADFLDNPGVGWGHTTAAGVPELHYDNIVCSGNGMRGFYCLAATRASTFGSISCSNNNGITPDGSDLQFGETGEDLVRFSAVSLSSSGSPTRGILIDGDVTEYVIGSVVGQGAGSQGFEDTCTGPTRGQVGMMLLVNNNQDGTVGANGAAVEVNRSGTFTVNSALFEDDQVSATQLGGFYFANGCIARVLAANFGADITTRYFTASANTTIYPPPGNVRTVTTTPYVADYDDETLLVDASGGAITVAFHDAANMTGKVYRIKKIDASGNAVTINPEAAETIDGAATYPLAAQWDAALVQCNGTAWFVLGIGP